MEFYNMFLGKIARVYTPNLVIIQQRFKKRPWSREKYFYALAAEFKISEDKTIIVMTSANINDHNSKNKKPFENTLIKSANLFKIDIDSEDDIRKGKLKKAIVNIAGYIIKKEDKCLDVTHVESEFQNVFPLINKHILHIYLSPPNIRKFMLSIHINFVNTTNITVITYKDILLWYSFHLMLVTLLGCMFELHL
ncbi:hypothetical protein [Plasmodium yoelii yoelii]|uniref:Uncharacterized protein n=1 Tax=Plasmodium yoelii yoelii TaxID=73239 RepID=Q7R8Q1_PLAYO|nr:hypothetical protein [Plasmodium yoelii yoelii]